MSFKNIVNIQNYKRQLAAFFGIATLALGTAATIGTSMASAAIATTASTTAMPLISFTFDDGIQSALTKAAPTLQKYGLTGTDYVITGCVGMTTTPNTCAADNDTKYMTWAQVQELQNTYHWEIGDHTADHSCMASDAAIDPDDCTNTAPLTTAQLETELHGSQQTLAANGITATDLAWPYGDYGNASLAVAAKYYSTTRGFADDDANNNYPYSDLVLHDQQFQAGAPTRSWAICADMTVTGAETCIDNAITNHQWVVLVFHDIEDTPSTSDDSINTLPPTSMPLPPTPLPSRPPDWPRSSTRIRGPVTGANLLPNGDFAAGIADGWTTDNPTASSRTPTTTAATRNRHIQSYCRATPRCRCTPGLTEGRRYLRPVIRT
ncbi:MAG: polysaccharide deacetylase family protein [Candidatus Saccharibacteria bacterium]